MARFERTEFNGHGYVPVGIFQDGEEGGEIYDALAERTAHEPVSLLKKIEPVVLEMDVFDVGDHTSEKVQGMLGSGKGISGVQSNAKIG